MKDHENIGEFAKHDDVKEVPYVVNADDDPLIPIEGPFPLGLSYDEAY